MDWRVKGIIQKGLGALPGGHALHFHLQRRFGGLRDFDGELASKVDDWETELPILLLKLVLK